MNDGLLHRVADRFQRLAGRSRLLVRLAVLVRNQARCVIKYHLAESPDVGETGEGWVRELAMPDARRVVDVGANVGDWLGGALAHARGGVAAIACEPSSSALVRLRARFAGDPRVRIVEAAFGDRDGEMTFLEEADAGRGSTLVPGLGRLEGIPRTVTVTTLASLFARAGWDGADLVKIDAEGFDARVIRGAYDLLHAQRIGVVQFEYNRSWQMAAQTLCGVYRLFEECGYRVFLLKREGLYQLDYARYEEYFEYSNFLAIAPAWMPRFASRERGVI